LYYENSPELHKPRPLVGPLILESDCGTTNNRQFNAVCMADIPISLDLFVLWIVDRFIKSDREQYYLMDVVSDALNSLLLSAITDSDCSGSRSISTSSYRAQTPYAMALAAPGNADGIDRVMPQAGGNDQSVATYGGIRLGDTQIAAILDAPPVFQSSDMINYFVLYVPNYDLFLDATTDDAWQRDAEKGVYWLSIGADSGLVKKVDFKAADAQYLREANLSRNQRTGWIYNVYNCDITMIGNTLFYPGQTVFISPSIVGVGHPSWENSLAYRMNLGGYFWVTQVESNLDSGVFDTKVQLNWISTGIPPKIEDEPVVVEPVAEPVPAETSTTDALTDIITGDTPIDNSTPTTVPWTGWNPNRSNRE
jgi:hypothetical protein